VQHPSSLRPRILAAIAVLIATTVTVGLGQRGAAATVTAVKGSAYGYLLNVSVFGGARETRGPAPTVALPSSGSASPVTATATSGSAVVGPATFFTSGQLTVSTQGTTGPSGSVTSSASITNINRGGQESFTASSVSSTCIANETGRSGSATINGGFVQTDGGDADSTNSIRDHPPVIVAVPADPAPNLSIAGHFHIGNTTESFRYVFNEQVANSDGSLTVHVAHEFLLGPTALGDLFIGKAECGVTAVATPPTTTPPTTSTSSTTTSSTTTSSTGPSTLPRFMSLVPGRVLETRPGFQTVDGMFNGIGTRPGGTVTELPVAGRAGVPAGADAVVLNLAVTGSTSPGFVTVFPCGQTRPNASSLNYSGGQTISNAVTAKIGDGGKICIFTFSDTDVIVDVTGAFVP